MIFIRIPYNKLQFVKEKDSFKASYDFSVEVSSRESEKIERKFWREEISTIDFNETSSPYLYLNTQTKLELLPGKYSVLLEISSLNSSQSFSLRKKVDMKSYWDKEIAISEPVFIDPVQRKLNRIEILSDSRNITTEFSKGLEIFVKIFNKSKEDFNLKWRVSSFYTDELELFANDVKVSERKMIIDKFITLDKNLLYSGPYIVVVTAEINGFIAEVKKRFNLMWINRPINLDNIDELISQMRYIIPKDTFELLRGESSDRKKEFFREFWSEKDPEPETKENELMKEYFRRIDYANQNFSFGNKLGWKTDRGRIYIVYGEPSRRILRYNEPGKPPFEIWIYSRINRKYLFVDKYRTGEFPLTQFTDEYNINYYYYRD